MYSLKYDSIKGELGVILEPNYSRCIKLLEDNKERFIKSPASLIKHQAWEGGYLDHLNDMMISASFLYHYMNNHRKLPFNIGDVKLVIFLHDLEKPFKYVDNIKIKNSEEFRDKKIEEYKIELTDEHKNALKYIHGEGKDHNPTERVMNELAAFCHLCDMISARIWYDYPKNSINASEV